MGGRARRVITCDETMLVGAGCMGTWVVIFYYMYRECGYDAFSLVYHGRFSTRA
jgi:hypothetical protein